MSEQVFQTRYETYRTAVESYLETLFAGRPDWRDLYESMRYSLLAGGKRIRPVLTLEFARLAGLADWKTALPMACALELVHTYSLIHDDLPCMDNDDLRRGKPTNHKVYGEATAVLAGDGLLTAAFETALEESAGLPPERVTAAAACLAQAAGARGMVGGQALDMAAQGRAVSRSEVEYLQKKKTGALLSAAAEMGCIVAGGSEEDRAAVRRYAQKLGLAFQVRDDMLDVCGDAAEFGKPIGSDKEEGKVTFMDLLGLEGCGRAVRAHTEAAKAAVADWDTDGFLAALADSLAERNK